MKYITLKKIESTHSNLRTDEVVGMTSALPKVGESFFMYTDKPLDPQMSMRAIRTSIVQEVKIVEDEIVFKTVNSMYSIIVTGEHN